MMVFVFYRIRISWFRVLDRALMEGKESEPS